MALIVMLSGVVNVCCGQFSSSFIWNTTEFIPTNEYFFKSIIDPTMFELVQIEEDGKLKKIKKNQSEYEILRNPQSLFEYKGPYLTKKDVEYYIFVKDNVKYCFPHYDKKGVDFGFQQYAVNFTTFRDQLAAVSENYNYVDAEYSSKFLKTEIKNDNLLYGRFLKVNWKGLELTKEQNYVCNLKVADNDLSIDYENFMTNYKYFLVPNQTIDSLNSLNERVTDYKSQYKYYDIQRDYNITPKDSSKLLYDRFYPVEITKLVADTYWGGRIQFVIDGQDYNRDENSLLYCLAKQYNIDRCKGLFEFVEKAKQEYKNIDVFFNNDDKTVSIHDSVLIYGLPLNIIKAVTDIDYNESIMFRVDSNNIYKLPIESFKKNIVTSDMIQERKTRYDMVMNNFEKIKPYSQYINIRFNDDFYYNHSSECVLYGTLTPMKILDLETNARGDALYKIDVNSTEYIVTTDELIKYTHDFAITSCSVSNTDGRGNTLLFDDLHSQYLKPHIKYKCATMDHPYICVKLYKPDGTLSMNAEKSPFGYSYGDTITLKQGDGSVALSGWGGNSFGHYQAGDYRYELYHKEDLIYTYAFTIPDSKTAPFTITSCSVANVDGNGNKLPFNASYTQFLQPTIKFTNAIPGTYQIDVRLYDDGVYGYSQSSNSPENYSYSSKITLSSKDGNVSVGKWGNSNSGYWPAHEYIYAFYYKGEVLYQYTFSIPEYSYDYIDLGLPSGTLWCTCNIGAKTPWGYGDYYAWGETSSKKRFGENNYKYSNANFTKLTKYCNNPQDGFNGYWDKLTVLQSSDDAASVRMGNGWCMPTEKQFKELIDYCTWRWTSNYEGHRVAGYIVSSRKYSGKHIFFPAAGAKYYDNDMSDCGGGYYWSRELFLSDSHSGSAIGLLFDPYSMDVGGFYRYDGYPIRAVRKK